jgi:hypothetical protein
MTTAVIIAFIYAKVNIQYFITSALNKEDMPRDLRYTTHTGLYERQAGCRLSERRVTAGWQELFREDKGESNAHR